LASAPDYGHLGRPGQPMYLLDRLAEDPDLVVITKPSLDLHLAAI
jgi:hypothetical protein